MPFSSVYLWTMLIARIYETLSLVCPQCGGEMEIIVFITEADPIQRVLNHISEPTTPPQIASACAPLVKWDADFDKILFRNRDNKLNRYQDLNMIKPSIGNSRRFNF